MMGRMGRKSECTKSTKKLKLFFILVDKGGRGRQLRPLQERERPLSRLRHPRVSLVRPRQTSHLLHGQVPLDGEEDVRQEV